RLVVLGEGLAAGLGHFGLSEESQSFSFPAQLARRMGVELHQPLFEPPGVGGAPGFPQLPVRVPIAPQNTVLRELPPQKPFANLAVPGFTLADALRRRPAPPLVSEEDPTQTLANLILGLPALLHGGGVGAAATKLHTQVELAREAQATFT